MKEATGGKVEARKKMIAANCKFSLL